MGGFCDKSALLRKPHPEEAFLVALQGSPIYHRLLVDWVALEINRQIDRYPPVTWTPIMGDRLLL
jgi:hypothetical protein